MSTGHSKRKNGLTHATSVSKFCHSFAGFSHASIINCVHVEAKSQIEEWISNVKIYVQLDSKTSHYLESTSASSS